MDSWRKEMISYLYIWLILVSMSINGDNRVNEVNSEYPLPDWTNIKPKHCLNDHNYRRPDKPFDVKVLLFIKSVYGVSEEDMEFGLQVDLVEAWKDSYLNLTGTKIADYEIMPKHVLDCIWRPDLIFYNAKETILFNVPIPNSYTTLNWDGVIVRQNRYRLVISCNMAFNLYPMDSQYCSIEIGLVASSVSEVNLTWDISGVAGTTNGIGLHSNIKPLNFVIKLLDGNVTSRQWAKKKEFLYANLLFTRSLVASIVNTYIPSFLVVCLSFVSFWLDVNAVPGRVTLGVTSILTLATSINLARGSLPTLDYMTAMDVWLLGCTIMVFLSLIEFTMAQSLSRTRYRNITKPGQTNFLVKVPTVWTEKFNNLRRKTCPKLKTAIKNVKPAEKLYITDLGHKDNILDRSSRVIFPTVLLTFTTGYWYYFLSRSNRCT